MRNYLTELLASFKRTDIVKNIAILVSGTIAGYFINFVLLPLISRVYSPMEIGEYDLIISTGTFVLDAIGLGLLIAIMLPKENKKAKNICSIMLVSNLFFLVLLGILFGGVFRKYELYHVSFNYLLSLFLLGTYLLTYNVQNIYYSFINREKNYKILFWNPILSAIANNAFSILFGLLGWGTAGYLLGTILSYILCIIYMSRQVCPFRRRLSISELKQTLIQYKEIPLIQLPANIISTISTVIPIQFFGRIFGTEMLGGYSMACKILSAPIALLATPVNRVIYRSIIEKKNANQNVGEFCFQVIEKNIKIAVFPIAVLIIGGKYIVAFVLGPQWENVSFYLSVLGFLYLLTFCSGCLSGTFVALGRQKISLLLSFIAILKCVITFGIIQIFHLPIEIAIVLYAVSESLYHIFNLYLCVIVTHFSKRKFGIFIIKYILGSSVIVYGLYAIIFIRG